MAKISLREYNREIEKMINRGSVDEAIAHCKYILKFFPKCIDIYRLLGNAFLESQRYTEASDIMGRVLSVIPDDFIAHVGMSIIREDEKNSDAAIWHMEKAYEVQPFNKPVQDELRRLLGQRDGVAPAKVRLTRGALVRMYARGDLFDQAIGEARAAIKEDPQRIDLYALIARLLFNNGQKLEAVEFCNAVIAKLPYCLEANLILSDFLYSTNRIEDAKIYAQRVASIDPYSAYCDPQHPTSSKVPDNAVSVEQLQYELASEAEKVPDWTQSVGINWQPSKSEEAPSWLTEITPKESKNESTELQHIQPFNIASPSDSTSLTPSFIPQTPPEVPSEQIPEWMTVAGWSPSTEEPQKIDQPLMVDDQQPSPQPQDASPGDIPEWLQELAPEETHIPAALPESGETDEMSMGTVIAQPEMPRENEEKSNLDLEPLAASITPVMPEIDSQESPVEEIPDWLHELESTSLPPQNETVPQIDLSQVEKAGELDREIPAEEHNEIPDWLKDLSSEVDLDPVNIEDTKPPQPVEDLVKVDLPDWLKSLSPSSPEAPVEPASSQEEKEALSWLESLADQPVADQVTIIGKTEQLSELPPSWIRDETQDSQPVTDLSSQPKFVDISSEIIPDMDQVEQAEPTNQEIPVAPTPGTEPVVDWLETLSAQQGVDQEALVTTPEDSITLPPGWIGQEIKSSQTQPVETPELTEEIPSVLESTPLVPEKSPEDMSPDEAMAWLEALAERQSNDQEPTVPQSEDRIISSLDWVAPDIEPTQTQPVETPELAEVVPAVLDSMLLVTEKSPEEMSPDEALAWLESLAERQGAEPDTLITVPDDRLTIPPERVVQDIETPMAQSVGTPEVIEEVPVIPDSTPVLSKKSPEEMSPDEALAWLESLAERQGVEPETRITHSEERIAEHPAWIAEDTVPDESLSTAEAEPSPAIETSLSTPTFDENLPAWMKELLSEKAQPGEPELVEKIIEELPQQSPGVQTSPEWQSSEIPLAESTIYTEPSVWLPEDVVLPKEDLPESQVPVEVLVSKLESESQELVDQPTAQEFLSYSMVQEALHKGMSDEISEIISNHIQNGQHLEEIIHDLRIALLRFPVDISIWQHLGDAYFKTNQLQEALESYTKAEELLR